MDRGTWWVTVHRATKSQTQLKQLSTQAHDGNHFAIYISIKSHCIPYTCTVLYISRQREKNLNNKKKILVNKYINK